MQIIILNISFHSSHIASAIFLADYHPLYLITQFINTAGDFILSLVISSSSPYTAYTWRRWFLIAVHYLLHHFKQLPHTVGHLIWARILSWTSLSHSNGDLLIADHYPQHLYTQLTHCFRDFFFCWSLSCTSFTQLTYCFLDLFHCRS